MASLGWEAEDIIANDPALQLQWARESDVKVFSSLFRLDPRLYRVPFFGAAMLSLPSLFGVMLEQVKKARPDVVYIQDIHYFPPRLLKEIKKYTRLLVGQIASPLPRHNFLAPYDLILTSFPHFVPMIRSLGVASEYFRIGFDPVVLNRMGPVAKDLDVTFVGGISKVHSKGTELLEFLCSRLPIEVYGYGREHLPSTSSIRRCHRGEAWGLDMYRVLARSKITINRHINVASDFANNMRLYEATGCAALLITDVKKNLGDLFEVNRELVAYQTKEEAVEKIHYYLKNSQMAQKIAKAGQERTLRTHSYAVRMGELSHILKAELKTRGI